MRERRALSGATASRVWHAAARTSLHASEVVHVCYEMPEHACVDGKDTRKGIDVQPARSLLSER